MPFYATKKDVAEDKKVTEIAQRKNLPLNKVEEIDMSQFIAHSIVDWDLARVAMGTKHTVLFLHKK